MKIRNFFLQALLWICIIALSLRADPLVREIRVTPEGSLKEIVVSLYEYDIIIDQNGIVKGVEIRTGCGIGGRYIIEKEVIKQDFKNGRHLQFTDGRVSFVDDVQFKYSTFERDRVERIGNLKFGYFRFEGKQDRLKHIGDLEFEYEINSSRLRAAGKARFHYDFRSRRIAEIYHSQSNCYYQIRVFNSLNNFK